MKVALVHEFLNQYGGGERMLEVISEMFPDAPIYTLLYNPEKMHDKFSGKTIYTSFLQKKLFSKNKYKWYLPWMPQAIESFDLSGYDLVISDSSAFGKGAITTTATKHICYCYTPTRYLWEDTFEYLKNSKIPWPASVATPYIINYLRIWDYNAAQRPDHIIGISQFVKDRIKKYYHRDAEVIYPFVYTDKFKLETKKDDFFLAAGRLVPYKRYDLIIKAFNKLPNEKLVIIGDGVARKELESMVKGDNVTFLGEVDDDSLAKNYAKAKAYIFPALEDFGITPLEAMSSGTPVIAYNKGGATETVVSGKTGVFFNEQTTSSLLDAIRKFKNMKFDPKIIRQQAEKFEKDVFKKEFNNYINKVIKERK